MKYREVGPVTREEMVAALRRNDAKELLVAIVGLALHHHDGHFVEETCLKLAEHPDARVRANAIESLGHAARRFGALDRAVVAPILAASLNDQSDLVRAKAADATDEIRHFLAWQISPSN